MAYRADELEGARAAAEVALRAEDGDGGAVVDALSAHPLAKVVDVEENLELGHLGASEMVGDGGKL